jgi:Cu-Zn family superoxide dismutase
MTIGHAAVTTLALDLTARTWVRPVWAQEAQRVSITVAPLTHAAPESKTQLSIQVRAQNSLPRNSFIRVRGLPPFAALSHGYAIASGSWSVPLIAAPGLAITVPAGTQGKSEIVIDLVGVDGSVLAEARTVLVIAPGSPVRDQHQNVLSAATARPDLDPSPLAAIRKGFDAFLALRTQTAGQKGEKRSAPTTAQKADMFREFLTWAQNPLEVDVNVRLTSATGVGEVVGTLTVKNSEIIVAGRKETALYLKPNLRGLRPGLYAFHVHENPNCGPALKDGEPVPGLAAGSHLWLSGTGELSGTTFTSHLGNLPHLEVDADGTATKVVLAARLTLADVANRSIMIHASHDDFSPRLACGRLN